MKKIKRTSLLVISANLILLSILSSVFLNINIFIFGMVFVILGTGFFIHNEDKLKLFHIVFLINIVITVLIYFINFYEYGNSYYIGGSDDLSYEEDAFKVAESLKWYEYFNIRGNIVPEWHNSVGYVFILSLIANIADVFGNFHTFLPRLLNSFLLGCIAILTFNISNVYLKSTKKFSRILAYIVSLFPIIVFVSAHSFRDVIILFIVMYVFYNWAIFKKMNNIHKVLNIIITIFLVIVAFTVREVVAFYLLAIILVFLFKIQKLELKNLITISLILLIIIIFFFNDMQILFERYHISYRDYLTDRSDGLSNIIFSYDIFPLGIVLRTLYAFISPFPSFSNSLEIWISIGTLIQLFFIFYLLKGLFKRDFLEIKIIYLIIFFSIIVTTFTFRHVLMYLPFAILISATEFNDNTSSTKKIVFLISYFSLITLLVVYFILKNIY